MHRLARVDALTGLPNVRPLRERLADAIAHGEAGGGGFALLMLDLDDFKRVNETYNHSHGDAVLVAVAEAIESNVRRGEMTARRGDDEFAVILNDAGLDAAQRAARRIGSAVARVRKRITPEITPTASLGFVAWRPGESFDDLLGRVDRELHSSKLRARQRRHSLGTSAHDRRLHSA